MKPRDQERANGSESANTEQHLASTHDQLNESEPGEPQREPTEPHFERAYDDLKRLAESHIRRRGVVGLSRTSVVHAAYQDMQKRSQLAFADRKSFFAYASQVMNGVVIRFLAQQRRHIRLEEASLDEVLQVIGELSAIDEALADLGAVDTSLADLVEKHVFHGIPLKGIAEERGVGERTVQRHWQKAKILLADLLTNGTLTNGVRECSASPGQR
jgi:DNA-directed RNA polymerase specialized sigma24 family protein